MSLALILAILVGVVAGAALTYWITQKDIKQQKQNHLEQNRKIREDLENIHESRMKTTIQSLQQDYDRQLTKTKQELEAAYESRLQESIKPPEVDYETELQQDNQPLEAEPQTVSTQDEFTVPAAEIPVITTQEIAETPAIENLVTPPQQITETPVVEATVSPAQSMSKLPVNSNDEPPIVETNPNVAAAKMPEQTEFKTSNYSNTNKLELQQKIAAWAKTGDSIYISPLIDLVYHADSQIRQSVASALGEITAAKNIRSNIQRVLPILGKLSKDANPSVRQAAVEALGKIKSEQVIPLLQKALRDFDGNVVKTANAALNQVKFYRVNQPLPKRAKR